jgi:hypothetical protein
LPLDHWNLLNRGANGSFKLRCRYAPPAPVILYRPPDQSTRDVVTIVARPLSRALHIQGLAVLVEQFTRERAGRRLGWAFAMRGGLIAQAQLDLLLQLAAHHRLVLPWMAFLLVADLAEVDRVRQSS